MGSQNKGSREGPRESGWEGCLQVGGLREPLGVRRSRSEGAGGLGAAGATVQSVLCGAPCPPRTGQNIGLRVGALAGGSGLRTPSLLCRQGSSVWARPGAMMPAGEQRLAGPGHLPVVPGEETQSPPVPPSTWLPLWDPRIQIGFLSHPTLPPGGSERVVVRVAPGRVCVGAVSRPRACFGAAAAGGLSREEEVSVSFWAWRGPVLAPLTEALRLNYEAGWGPSPLSQTPPGTEAGGSPCSRFSLVTCPEGQQTDVPGTWDASPVLLCLWSRPWGPCGAPAGRSWQGSHPPLC